MRESICSLTDYQLILLPEVLGLLCKYSYLYLSVQISSCCPQMLHSGWLYERLKFVSYVALWNGLYQATQYSPLNSNSILSINSGWLYGLKLEEHLESCGIILCAYQKGEFEKNVVWLIIFCGRNICTMKQHTKLI